MKRSAIMALACVALALGMVSVAVAAEDQASSAVQSPAGKGPGPGKTILWFDVMYGVDGPFLEDKGNPIRGIPGDELPWEIKSVQGKLDTKGHLNIHINGLVFTDDDIVPPGLRGKNDEDHFRALVSCMTEVDEDTVAVQNVVSAPFPANSKGDAKFNGKLNLPESCIAPVIMILAGSENKWFAVTGFEAEGDED
jgi:hypothetical protein